MKYRPDKANFFRAVILPSDVSAVFTNNIIELHDTNCLNVGITRLGTGTAPFVSDYNCIYGSGGYCCTGETSSGLHCSLASWTDVTEQDAHSIEQIPQFAGLIDLHIQPSATVVDGQGIHVSWIAEDMDGEARENPPDIGADEYTPAIDPVTDLVVSVDAPASEVTLRWTPPSGANGYLINKSDEPDFLLGEFSFVAATDDTFYVDLGIPHGNDILRFYKVVASSESLPERRGNDKSLRSIENKSHK